MQLQRLFTAYNHIERMRYNLCTFTDGFDAPFMIEENLSYNISNLSFLDSKIPSFEVLLKFIASNDSLRTGLRQIDFSGTGADQGENARQIENARNELSFDKEIQVEIGPDASGRCGNQ